MLGANSTLKHLTFFILLFVCFFVVIKPENPYFASYIGLEVKPLGAYQLGPRSSSCGVCVALFY